MPSANRFALALGTAAICALGAQPAHADSLTKAAFGKLPNGTEVEQYTMTNANGVAVKFITLGGCITAMDTPDRTGHMANIVLGYHDLAGYDTNNTYFGAHHRPLRQPHRQGHLHPGWQDLPSAGQQRGEFAAWRHHRLQSADLEGHAGNREGRRRRQAHLHQPRRPGRLSGHTEDHRHLYAHGFRTH